MTTPHKSPPPPPPPRSSPPRQLRPANRPRLLTPPSSPAASSPPGESPHLLASPPRPQIPAVSSLRAHPPSSSRRGSEVVPFRCHPRCPHRRRGRPQPPPEQWSSPEPTSTPVATGAEFFPIRGSRSRSRPHLPPPPPMGLVDLSSLSAVKFHHDPELKLDIELRADQFTCQVPPSQSILRITRDKMIINTPAQEGV